MDSLWVDCCADAKGSTARVAARRKVKVFIAFTRLRLVEQLNMMNKEEKS